MMFRKPANSTHSILYCANLRNANHSIKLSSHNVLFQATSRGHCHFDQVEVLDYSAPFEVFSVTRMAGEDPNTSPSPFRVLLVAQSLDPVTTVGGMRVLPHVTYRDCPPLDILVVPGGFGSRAQRDNAATLDFLRQQAIQASIVASVCTGALLLGRIGLLDGRTSTTHWGALDLLQADCPATKVVGDRHWIVEDGGRLYTSAGISAGIDMSLKVVEQVLGQATARATAKQMEYPYPVSDERRIQI